jgi:hypothetical protein
MEETLPGCATQGSRKSLLPSCALRTPFPVLGPEKSGYSHNQTGHHIVIERRSERITILSGCLQVDEPHGSPLPLPSELPRPWLSQQFPFDWRQLSLHFHGESQGNTDTVSSTPPPEQLALCIFFGTTPSAKAALSKARYVSHAWGAASPSNFNFFMFSMSYMAIFL